MDHMYAILEDACGTLTMREIAIMAMTSGESPGDIDWEPSDSERDEDDST